MKRIKRRVFSAALVAAVAVGSGLYADNTRVDVEEIKVEIIGLPAEFHDFRIAQLSDLHLPHCVRSPEKLAALVKELHPDIIALTGDLTDRFSAFDADGLQKLAQELTAIAPCYAVAGNHEIIAGVLEQWTTILRDADVTVLDGQPVVVRRNDAKITLYGLPFGNPSSYGDNQPMGDVNLPLDGRGSTATADDGVCVVLSHYPENIPKYAVAELDLVLCGHAHGGQFRLFGQGLISPGEGLFPIYTSGLYRQDDTQMVVSRGLKNGIPLRVFNAPHLPVVVLQSPDEQE